MNEKSPNLRIPEQKKPKKWEEPKSRDTGRWAVAATVVIIALVASGLFIAKAVKEDDTDSSDTDSVSTETSTSSDEEVDDDYEEIPIPDGKGEDEDDGAVWDTWRTSEDHFIISIPTDWEIMQADGGRTSLVTILDEDGSRRLMVFVGSARAEDDKLLTLDEWRLTIADIPGTEACLSRMLGGISMSCFKEDGKEVFYGPFSEGLYTRVVTLQTEDTAAAIGEILQSLRYDPSNQDIEGTNVIP